MIPSPDLLPCGCLIRYAHVNGVNTMTFIPCHTECENYQNMLREAAEQNKPVERREG